MTTGKTAYEARYAAKEYYWGTEPAAFCAELCGVCPPAPGRTVLDIGCGEGKDAVYMAQQGYTVTAFDLAKAGIRKANRLASERGVKLHAYVDDINTFHTEARFDIVYSSGTLQFLTGENKQGFFEKIDRITKLHGLVYLNVFVAKPFLAPAPDWDPEETLWKPGELFGYLPDWKIHRIDEIIFEDRSGGIPHVHCMDLMLCEKMRERGQTAEGPARAAE